MQWTALWSSRNGQIYSSPSQRGCKAGYLACGLSNHYLNLSDDGSVLIARGFTFDTIRQLSIQLDRKGYPMPSEPISRSSEELLPQQTPYGSVNDTYEAVWRTLVQDRRDLYKNAKPPPKWGFYFQQMYSTRAEGWRRATRNSVTLARDFVIYDRSLYEWTQFGRLLSTEEESVDKNQSFDEAPASNKADQTDDRGLENYRRSIWIGSLSSRLMITGKGYFGVGHCQSRVGDSICLIQGCSMPTILRPYEDGWKIIGESYVHGIMDGEFWAEQDENMMQEFRLY
jgi:hypothetical protein